jgi:TRAP-type C4-dicarboxylate transport system substrate-binding protein
MEGTMRLIRQAMIAALALGCGTQVVSAQESRLIFTSLSPGGSPNSVFFNAWAKKVSDQSGGTLKIEVRDGVSLATFGNAYDRVMNDVIQIGWVQPAFVAGKFPLAEITNLPFMTDNDVSCSLALSRYYKSAVMEAELKDVVPIWASCLAQTGLHFSKPLRSDTDLANLKLRVAGKVPSQIIERMGGTPVSMTAEAIYESLQRGTIDGTVTSWAAFEPYKLHEVTTYHVEVPIGSTPSMFMMSRKKYDSLPAAARKALADNTGEAAVLEAAKHFAAQAQRSREKVAQLSNHKIAALTPAQLAVWRDKLTPITSEWAKERPGADKAVETFRDIYAKVKASR